MGRGAEQRPELYGRRRITKAERKELIILAHALSNHTWEEPERNSLGKPTEFSKIQLPNK